MKYHHPSNLPADLHVDPGTYPLKPFKFLFFAGDIRNMAALLALRQAQDGSASFIEPSQEDTYQSGLIGEPEVVFMKANVHMAEHFISVAVFIGM
jgi:hypothetical protein